MAGLNERLRTREDGAVIGAVDLAYWDGVKSVHSIIRVYWPFGIVKNHRRYDVQHLPTGRFVKTCETLGGAVDVVTALREEADFDFTSVKGRKSLRAKARTRHLLNPVRPVA